MAQGLCGTRRAWRRGRGVAGALLWFIVALIFRRQFQFSIRSLLLLAVAIALPCGWMTAAMKKAREQLEAVRWIESLEGEMHYDWDVDEQGIQLLNAQPPGPEWLRDLLGDTFFSEVVDFYPSPTTSIIGPPDTRPR